MVSPRFAPYDETPLGPHYSHPGDELEVTGAAIPGLLRSSANIKVIYCQLFALWDLIAGVTSGSRGGSHCDQNLANKMFSEIPRLSRSLHLG